MSESLASLLRKIRQLEQERLDRGEDLVVLIHRFGTSSTPSVVDSCGFATYGDHMISRIAAESEDEFSERVSRHIQKLPPNSGPVRVAILHPGNNLGAGHGF